MKKIIDIIKNSYLKSKEDYISLGKELTKYIDEKSNNEEKLILYEMIGTHFEEQDQQRDWIIEGASHILVNEEKIRFMTDGINQIRLYTEVLRNNLEELINLNFDSPEVKTMILTLKDLLISLNNKNEIQDNYNKTTYLYN